MNNLKHHIEDWLKHEFSNERKLIPPEKNKNSVLLDILQRYSHSSLEKDKQQTLIKVKDFTIEEKKLISTEVPFTLKATTDAEAHCA